MKSYISERAWHPQSSFWIVNWFRLIVDLLLIFTINIFIMYQIRWCMIYSIRCGDTYHCSPDHFNRNWHNLKFHVRKKDLSHFHTDLSHFQAGHVNSPHWFHHKLPGLKVISVRVVLHTSLLLTIGNGPVFLHQNFTESLLMWPHL